MRNFDTQDQKKKSSWNIKLSFNLLMQITQVWVFLLLSIVMASHVDKLLILIVNTLNWLKITIELTVWKYIAITIIL